MVPFFNISLRKVGGIRFLKLGRLNVSFSVTSRETIERRAADARRAQAATDIDAMLSRMAAERRERDSRIILAFVAAGQAE